MGVHEPTEFVRNVSTDSRRWSNYEPRPNDVVVATSEKCGTKGYENGLRIKLLL